ncbi:C2 domain-containing protein [Aureococcus anophagefferens]|nr:C2 domain-containing protein [Aureococcus anophagefferens]
MWALPAALAVGVVLERAGCPLVVTSAIAVLLALTSYLGERRAASLAAARKEREAEDLDQRFREAALASGVKISPREKILLEELDCRTWLDQALTTLGAAAPRVRRVVPVRLAEDGVVMLDLDLDWRGSGVDVDLSARLGGGWIGASVPLGLDHVSFKATLRVRCVLGDRSPFAALVDVAFARKPEVLDFGLSVISGDITGLPSIPALVSNALEGVIDGLMVWPRRLSFPLDEWPRSARRAGLGRGRALLKRGAILKEGFGGFKRWSHRWLELELELDLTADGFRLAAVPEINQLAARRYGKPASTDDAEAARGEVRLSPDAAVSILEEKKKQAVVEVRTGASKPWRFAPLDADASSWVAALEAASAALGLDGAALRSAGENGDAVDLYSGATWFESHEFCGGVALGESRGEYADFSADGATLHIDVYDADPHGASEHLGAATFPLRDVDDAVGGAVWAPLAAPPGRAGAAGDVRLRVTRRAFAARALDRPKQMAGGVGTAATVLRAANIFRSKANTPDRVSCLSAMGASRRVDDSDDDDDDGTPKRTACVNFRRRSGDGGGVEPVPEAMTR